MLMTVDVYHFGAFFYLFCCVKYFQVKFAVCKQNDCVFNDVYPELYLQQYRRTSGFKNNPLIETACDLVNCVNEIYIHTYIAITLH